MMRTHDRQAHAGSRLLILATLSLAVALVCLLFGKLGATPDVPVYAASPLLPPTLLAPPDTAVVSDTTPPLSWAASPPPASGYYLKVDGWVKNVGSATSGEPNPLIDGPHTSTVAAYDTVGNLSAYADPWSLIIDTTPPSVLLTEPADGATEVALDAPLEIRFSEAVDTGTFAFSVSPDPGAWVETWSEGDHVVTWTHAAFAQSTTYTVTVEAAVDLAGLPMTGSYSWSFETETYSLYLPVVMRNY